MFGINKPKNIDWLVVGLGNPGRKYQGTRHNAGFMAADALAKRLGITVDRLKFHALTGDGICGEQRIILAKPQTFMNLSGQAVDEIMRYYKIPPERLLVMCDDISLDPGKLRIRRKGSHGGQNGMRNIIDMIESSDFCRIKLGIGAKPHPDYSLADWVLSCFTVGELKEMEQSAANAAEAAELIVNGEIDKAMNLFNS
ncbi:MAG: aminoacyl-tRNA hydrolase [Clostridia bacterium]|nr:aminoacyl-tRNA hydrolase [Clostridia bacterium]